MTTQTNSTLLDLLGGIGPPRGPNPADYPFLADIIYQKALELAQPNANKKEVDEIIVTAWLKKIERLLEWRNGQRVLTEEGEAYFEVTRGPTTTTDTVTFLEVQLKATICEKVKKMLELHKYSDLVKVFNQKRKSSRPVFDSLLYPVETIGGITGGLITDGLLGLVNLLEVKPSVLVGVTVIATGPVAVDMAQDIFLPEIKIAKRGLAFLSEGFDLLTELFDGTDPSLAYLQFVYKREAGPWQSFYLGKEEGFEINIYGEVVEGLEKAWKKIPCGLIGPTTGGPSYRQAIFETIGFPPSPSQQIRIPDLRPV